MKLTKTKLKNMNPCRKGYEWYLEQKTTDFFEICKRLKKDKRLDDLNWILPRMMNKKQCVQYAIYAAEKVIEIYNYRYPNDNRPNDAIKAAKAYLQNPCKETMTAGAGAGADAYVADAAAAYAAAADAATYAATYAAAYAAAYAADAAAYAAAAAAAAAYAAAAATYAAAYAADAATMDKLLLNICNYGIRILKKDKK